MNVIPMPPNPADLKTDEITINALRLMKCFFKLGSRSRREELPRLAEGMLDNNVLPAAEPGE